VQERAVGTPLIALGPALVANSLFRGPESYRMRAKVSQIGNSGVERFSHEDTSHFSSALEFVLSGSELLETVRPVEFHGGQRRIPIEFYGSALSSRALGEGEESRANPAPGGIPADINRRAMLAPFEPVGGKSDDSLLIARLVVDGDKVNLAPSIDRL